MQALPSQYMSGPCFQYLAQYFQVDPLEKHRKIFVSNKYATRKPKLQYKIRKINSPTATLVSPGRSIRVRFTTAIV